LILGNYVHDNGDAGMALMESFNADVSDNVFENNKYGVRMSVGCGDNVFSDNVISDSTRYNVYTYEGSDDPWVADSGRSQDNIFSDNTIIGGPESIKLGEADGTEFIDNTFEDPEKIRFQDSTRTVMSGNTGLGDVELRITDGACFDDSSDSAFTPVC
ncbi:unnamed protein product, partial [Laminaria digitata]